MLKHVVIGAIFYRGMNGVIAQRQSVMTPVNKRECESAADLLARIT